MGTNIIIPGADFSQIAVDKIDGEPTDFIQIVGFKVASAQNVGDYFISGTDGSIKIKTEESYEDAQLQPNTIIKYKGYYFVIQESTPPFYLPYYNSDNIKNPEANVYIIDNGEISKSSNSATATWKSQKIELNNGQTLIYNSWGGETPKALIIENSGGNVSVEDSSTTNSQNKYDIKMYTNNTGGKVNAYINYPNGADSYVIVAKSNGK